MSEMAKMRERERNEAREYGEVCSIEKNIVILIKFTELCNVLDSTCTGFHYLSLAEDELKTPEDSRTALEKI